MKMQGLFLANSVIGQVKPGIIVNMLLLNAPTYKHYFKDILTNKRELPLISTYYIKMTEE
jgi:hypothetical protein